ncbi:MULTISPECIES: hypothetical protein [Pseudomonas]|uniref:Uncharacterized protein n=1 Tax=Pseudomonas simiae TaxID=321846 RepID=A0ABS9G9V3_9PSED|nr:MULTISPECIES: hypothetical protein [Pseudomonas]MCF5188626.1 hypothetical protein [Pseudomonas simiae]MCF5289476.1 hypothetical protein [Pseudomonas simiae]MCF5321794.1 hypothetical protein [Pseudomonas simiae]MCF5338366.1 hypothetical protein [Pseudomonas simiae]MCF5343942.1 hypothetical protein [Pseudomonas simiae]
MFKLEAYYLAAMTSCERLTNGVIQNSNAIMASVHVIEENFLRASKAVANATGAGDAKTSTQPISIPAVILEKEMLNLVFSLSELKSAVRTRLSSTLQDLNVILTDAAGANPIISDPEVFKAYQKYREVLVECIHTLEHFSDKLFEAKTYKK